MCVVQLIDDGNHAFAARIVAGFEAAGELTHDFFAKRPALKFDPFPFYKKDCRFPPTCRSTSGTVTDARLDLPRSRARDVSSSRLKHWIGSASRRWWRLCCASPNDPIIGDHR